MRASVLQQHCSLWYPMSYMHLNSSSVKRYHSSTTIVTITKYGHMYVCWHLQWPPCLFRRMVYIVPFSPRKVFSTSAVGSPQPPLVSKKVGGSWSQHDGLGHQQQMNIEYDINTPSSSSQKMTKHSIVSPFHFLDKPQVH